MLDRLAQGIELALRSGAAPLLLGARLAGRVSAAPDPALPARKSSLALASKIVLDEIFFASELASATFVARRDHRRVVGETEDALAFYEDQGWLDDPSSFHLDPPALERVTLTRVYRPRLPYLHLRAPTTTSRIPASPAAALARLHPDPHPARLAAAPQRPAAALAGLRAGYRMGHPLVDFTDSARAGCTTLGVNVAIPVMPLHGPAASDGAAATASSRRLHDTVHRGQAVWDVRRLIGWLRAQGAPGVGVYGVSLGGYTAALIASLERDLSCVIAGIPAIDFVRLLRAHAPSLLVRAAERAGFSFERTERLLRVVSPLALAPKLEHSRRFLYAGLADRLASPDQASDIWRHWDKPRTLWYQGGHVSFVWEPEIQTLLAEALAAGELLTPPRSCPRGYSPRCCGPSPAGRCSSRRARLRDTARRSAPLRDPRRRSDGTPGPVRAADDAAADRAPHRPQRCRRLLGAGSDGPGGFLYAHPGGLAARGRCERDAGRGAAGHARRQRDPAHGAHRELPGLRGG